MIEARDIHVNIGENELLAGVSLEVRPGEVVAVVGPNGAGKSTLRKALCGDIEISGGEVLMNGRALSQWSLIERARARAVMPQDSSLNFPFTVLEVVLMGRSPHVKGAEGAHDYEVARRALEAVEARHLEERLYPTLSGGERQRVHLARALAQIREGSDAEARFLLLDEPTSSLDISHQHSALGIARKLTADRVGVFVILHDLNLAAQYADRVLMMKDGQVIASGTPMEVFTRDAIRETFSIPVLVTQHPSLLCPLVVPDVAR